LLFNEKECCEEMSTQILKCISELCQEYNSKSSIWYRNFFREKFIIKKNFTSIHEKFYNTFLHPKISGVDHNFEDFMRDNKKMCNYHKYYLQFDHESGSKLTLRNQISELKKTKKRNEKYNTQDHLISYLSSQKKHIPFERSMEKNNL